MVPQGHWVRVGHGHHYHMVGMSEVLCCQRLTSESV